MMKKFITILIVMIWIAGQIHGVTGEIIYLDGEVSIRTTANAWYEPEIGDNVYTGDTIVTKEDGYVEILRDDATILISASTVFRFMEAEKKGKKQSVFSCSVGSIYLKIQKATGNAPEVSTVSASAGVRGTEFTVFSGSDGSSLITVTEGIVDVNSKGVSVLVNTDEGVEVAPGQPPGEKFKVLRGQIDFKNWEKEKYDGFLKDPAAAIVKLSDQLNDFIEQINQILPVYEANKLNLEQEREKLINIEKDEGKQARTDYYSANVFPLEVETGYMLLNIRYYALSALSLRSYVLTNLYTQMKADYLGNFDDPVYKDFLDAHWAALNKYEVNIIPHLVDADF